MVVAATADGNDLSFSDPSRTPKAPAWAVGQASREPSLNVLPGFLSPPDGFGAVPFFWWMGDPLTKERLTWELDKLSNRHLSGLQINYAHGTHGGLSYGLTLPSEPAIFSDSWWQLTEWFMGESKRRGMSISLSDYTLGVGQGAIMDEMLAANPDLNGYQLERVVRAVTSEPLACDIHPATVSLTAYQVVDDQIVPDSGVDLRPLVTHGHLAWSPPAGRWQISQVQAVRRTATLDPMNRRSGSEYAKAFFGRFENHAPGEAGKGLNFFFSDELEFRIKGLIWTERFAAEFSRRKGYDLAPEMAGLWTDIGPRTPKIRLDYSDVKAALTEEGFFKPVFDWHQSRGMIMGCDHGGRGGDVTEFGDYFRTQRWMQGPGSDQPGLGKNLIKAKVASSIAHLYERPRVWLEGWYGSGWGTSSAAAADALFADFTMGYNLLSFHGCYYSTHGGWWEWAPPCNTYHMPYWDHMGPFMDCAQRLSYLFSQGRHVCDVAVIYPVAPEEANLGGQVAVTTAFDSGSALYEHGLDFDFMDFESLDRATLEGGRIRVAGESYRVLVLPAMAAIRHSTLRKAAEFVRHGGTVVAVGALPIASDRQGRDDSEVDELNREVFGMGAADAARLQAPSLRVHAGGGRGIVVSAPADIEAALGEGFPRDFRRTARVSGGYINHRKLGARDLFAVYALPKDEECRFRATGKVELWDPWTGTTMPLPVMEQAAGITRLRLPLSHDEIQLIVFTPGKPAIAEPRVGDSVVSKCVLTGEWGFELQPNLDNRWGDYHWPPTPTRIGAEVRSFRYADEAPRSSGWESAAFDATGWRTQTYSYGPQFWKLGPLPAAGDVSELERALAASERIDPAVPVHVGSRDYRWQSYDFSWRFGVEGDAGYQGYHGLKERMYDEYIRLGKILDRPFVSTREAEPDGSRYYLWTSVPTTATGPCKVLHGGAPPAAAWLNGSNFSVAASQADLRAGSNFLLLRYDRPGTGHFTFATPESTQQDSPPSVADPAVGPTVGTLAMRWSGDSTVYPFDARPAEAHPAGWYRFESAPGMQALRVIAHGSLTGWADGVQCSVTRGAHRADGAIDYRVEVATPAQRSVSVALRIEQDRGHYGGAAIPEPIQQECRAGLIHLGDWGALEGLRCYSGGVLYRKSFIMETRPNKSRVFLDLGDVVASAELRVNGQSAGIKVAPPWRWDVSSLTHSGENHIEVLVYNTLANHYQTIPSRYKNPAVSGVLGPVTVVVEK